MANAAKTVGTRVACQEAAAGARTGLLDQSSLQRLIGYNLRRAEVQMRGKVAQVLGEYEIRAVEFSILSLIANNREVTQKDLGEALSVKRPNMVSLIERLETRGLLVRQVLVRDRRNQGLSPTPAGRDLLRRLDTRLEALEGEFFSAWTAREREQLVEMLRRIHAGT